MADDGGQTQGVITNKKLSLYALTLGAYIAVPKVGNVRYRPGLSARIL